MRKGGEAKAAIGKTESLGLFRQKTPNNINKMFPVFSDNLSGLFDAKLEHDFVTVAQVLETPETMLGRDFFTAPIE